MRYDTRSWRGVVGQQEDIAAVKNEDIVVIQVQEVVLAQALIAAQATQLP